MKWTRLAFILSAVPFLNASANDFNGTWKAVFIGPAGARPRMPSEMVFNFNVDGSKVTGVAHMGSWPGDAEISDGKIDGDRITFTVIGKHPWTGSNGSGYPKLAFAGTLKGGSMDIKLNWGSIMITGEHRSGPQLDMSAKRTSE